MLELLHRLPMEEFVQGHPIGNLVQRLPMKSSYAIASTESSNARAPAEISMEEFLQGYPIGQWESSYAIVCLRN